MESISRRNFLASSAAYLAAPAVLSLSPSTAWAADPYADAVLVDGAPPAPTAGSFTIAVLPDTQNYSTSYPEISRAQTRWITEERDKRNIPCALQLGDITNNNTPKEWENAVAAMAELDARVPCFMVPGNHDYSKSGSCTDRTTLLNEYFPIANVKDRETFGGVYDKEPQRMENSFHLFSAAGREFLVLGLEFGPRRDVVRWANEVVAAHPDRETILITHAYMYYDDTRYDWKKYGSKQRWNPHAYRVAKNTNDDVTDGDELWNKLVSRHDNFIMTLNGHVLQDGLGRLASKSRAGRTIHQMLVNFQMRPNGGDGWLRLMEFQPNGTTVRIQDYSPTRNQCNNAPENKFVIELAKTPV